MRGWTEVRVARRQGGVSAATAVGHSLEKGSTTARRSVGPAPRGPRPRGPSMLALLASPELWWSEEVGASARRRWSAAAEARVARSHPRTQDEGAGQDQGKGGSAIEATRGASAGRKRNEGRGRTRKKSPPPPPPGLSLDRLACREEKKLRRGGEARETGRGGDETLFPPVPRPVPPRSSRPRQAGDGRGRRKRGWQKECRTHPLHSFFSGSLPGASCGRPRGGGGGGKEAGRVWAPWGFGAARLATRGELCSSRAWNRGR